SAGLNVTNSYNHQGLLVASSNAFGRIHSVLYDIEDHATNRVDASGVITSLTYDELGRMISRATVGGGTERLGYWARGMNALTNALNQVTRYGLDALGRKTSETNANLEVARFTYDAAGDVLTLLDGKSQGTTWAYDQFG